MNIQHNILLFILLILPGPSVRAQSLVSLLAEADSANLELKALYTDYLAALEKAPQVSQLPEPEAGFGIFILPVETRLGPQWVRLSATQAFPWKGTLKTRQDISVVMAKAQYEKIANARLLMHYQVRQSWYQYYELEKRQAILQKSIELFRSLESLVTTKMAAGKADLSDVLRIQLRIQEMETEISTLKNQQEKPLATINQLLSRPSDTPLTLADTLSMTEIPYDPESLLDSIAGSHPMIRMYDWQREASQMNIELNRLEGMPSFAVGIDYITVGKRTDAEPEGNGRDILGPRVGVRVPLYRDKYKAREQEEQLRIEALGIRQKDQVLQFRAGIQRAFSDAEEARLQYDLSLRQHQTLDTVWALLLQEYQTNGARFIDLLQVDNQRIQYELLELSAIVKSHRALTEVERFFK